MVGFTQQPPGRRSGFTLIELLVVVAIIALLISILLPSLSKARAQARTTLCSSRIAQMAKAFVIYSDDFSETPPFICYGRGKVPGDPNCGDKITNWENWLAGPDELNILWDHPEADWPANWAKNGWIFSYTRFEALYRCPEFERVKNQDNVQNQFNYSRCSLGRMARLNLDDISTQDSVTPYGIGYNGPICRMSMPYAASKLPIVVDEDWFAYIGYYGTMSFSWDQCDPVMDIADSFIGAYHGTAVRGACFLGTRWATDDMRKSGSVAMYDGHVELIRDWLPRRGSGDRGGRELPIDPDISPIYMDMIGQFFYAQAGRATVDIFSGG